MYPPLWDFFRPTRRRRVNIIRISKTKAFEGIFPWVVWSRWNIFQLGALWRARPIKFARPRRGNNSRGGRPPSEASPRFSVPPFLATFLRFHARLIGKDCVSLGWPYAAPQPRCFSRALDLSSWRVLRALPRVSLSAFWGGSLWILLLPSLIHSLFPQSRSREIKANRGVSYFSDLRMRLTSLRGPPTPDKSFVIESFWEEARIEIADFFLRFFATLFISYVCTLAAFTSLG